MFSTYQVSVWKAREVSILQSRSNDPDNCSHLKQMVCWHVIAMCKHNDVILLWCWNNWISENVYKLLQVTFTDIFPVLYFCTNCILFYVLNSISCILTCVLIGFPIDKWHGISHIKKKKKSLIKFLIKFD